MRLLNRAQTHQIELEKAEFYSKLFSLITQAVSELDSISHVDKHWVDVDFTSGPLAVVVSGPGYKQQGFSELVCVGQPVSKRHIRHTLLEWRRDLPRELTVQVFFQILFYRIQYEKSSLFTQLVQQQAVVRRQVYEDLNK